MSPELLMRLERDVTEVLKAGYPSFRLEAQTLLALVARIRELEGHRRRCEQCSRHDAAQAWLK